MELTNTFRVAGSVDRAWAVITDIERVAPCLPGAALLGVDGSDYRGAVKIKVGPVTARYEGVARFTERDDEKHHAVMRAEGRDVRGQGNATATIDLRLSPRGDGTEVLVLADLELAGRVAQFGRGVIADVTSKLIGQFAERLEQEMGQQPADSPPVDGTPRARPPGSATRPARRPTSIDDVEPVDLFAAGGGPVLALLSRQALPLGSLALGLLIGWLTGRAGHRHRHAPGPPASGLAPVIVQLVLPGAVERFPDGADSS